LSRVGLILFSGFLSIGQFFFALGAYNYSYLQMLAGRFIFGLGGDCVTVGKSTILSKWFKGKELAFAFGLTLSVGRLGSVVSGWVLPGLADSHSVAYALFIGTFVCMASFICTLTLVAIDYYVDKQEAKHM
jgi:nitrate/nitrite transporter NarK